MNFNICRNEVQLIFNGLTCLSLVYFFRKENEQKFKYVHGLLEESVPHPEIIGGIRTPAKHKIRPHMHNASTHDHAGAPLQGGGAEAEPLHGREYLHMWPYFVFFSAARDISNKRGIEAFDVDTHFRLLERGNIIQILSGNNDKYERIRRPRSSFFN